MKKILKKAEKKVKRQGEEVTKRVKDVTTELYPIDEMIREIVQEGEEVLAK